MERLWCGTRNAPPCKGCTERAPGCHDHCEPFAEYRAEIDRIAANKRKHYSKPFSPIM